MDLLQFITKNYGYNEPVLSEDLRERINLEDSTLRQYLKRLTDRNELVRYSEGIYFIPDPNSVLKKNNYLSFNKIISKKYLTDNNQTIGYLTGIYFANNLRLTAQTAGTLEIVTNKETNYSRPVRLKNRNLILRKPKAKVTNDNYKVLQVLDLILNLDKLSEVPQDKALSQVLDYVKDNKLNYSDLNNILLNYPKKVIKKVYESGLYDALT